MASPTPAPDAILDALLGDRTVDLLTTGARSGAPRTTEIWTTILAGEVFICGTPATGRPEVERVPRDWLANLAADPRCTLRLKSTVHVELAAVATRVTDEAERRHVLSQPATAYYRTKADSFGQALRWSPIVRLRFVAADAWLNDAVRERAADRS